MSSIQGLDRLIRKLEKVSDLPYSEIIQQAADEFKEALRSSAATFSTFSTRFCLFFSAKLKYKSGASS